MRQSTAWSLVLGLTAAIAFAVPSVILVHDAYAKGGGTGSSGGKGGGGSGGGGGKSGGAGGGAGKSGGSGAKGGAGSGGPAGGGAGAAKSKSNTANTKGRGDYLEQMQHDESDDQRAGFLDDATADVVRASRAAERGE
jgi:hypothetical protein